MFRSAYGSCFRCVNGKEIFREKKISATTKIDKKQKKNVGWNKGDKNEEEKNNKNKNLEDIPQQNNSEAFQEEEEEQQQLRLMPLHIKELAKMRIQQVIFECNSSTFASFHQFAQLQSKPQNSRSNDSPAATNFSTEQNNGIEQTLEINGEREENNEEVDVITVEEQQQKLNNETN
uniref:Uncharacterized protein n=1 Tax=Meloidogyne javanica TaxID=6303 RepID=A0A915LDX8_MELJA